MKRTARNRLTAALVLAGALVLAAVLHRHEPLGHWLFLRYLRAAVSAGVFSLSCLVAGHALVVRALGRTFSLHEHVAIALPLGVFAFFFACFVFGVLGLHGSMVFVLCPCVLVALGARDFLRTLSRLRRHGARLRLEVALDPLRLAILAFGCLGVLYLWFTILTPSNASYDARWYHLPIAETYASEGGIRPFGEGWVFGAFPQLASVLYSWAFAAPGVLFDRVETAAHVELATFLMTLVGVSAIVRRVLGRSAPFAWASVFLFPGIFCYDSGLVLGADHIAAAFAAPIFFLSLRHLESPSRGVAWLLGAAVAGALCTKYSAVILLPLPVAAVLARALADFRTPRDRRACAPAGIIVLSTVLFTSPHWLKNWVFYGDPLFPLLASWLPARPWQVAAEAPFAMWFHLHHPPPSLASFWEMLKTLVTFSFVPHDFPVYHRDLPVFGSLFTLVTPLLVFLGRRRRLAWLFVGAYLGLAAWFWIHQFDRYLQVLVPWMAAATAVVLTLLWQERGLLRPAIFVLVALQAIWGAAVPFFPSHRAAASTIVNVVSDLLGRGFRGESGTPPSAYPEWEAIGRALPRNATLLVHEERIRAGLSVASLSDFPGEQGAFYWGESGVSTPAGVWRRLREHGITHLLWKPDFDQGFDTVAGALVFFDFAKHYTTPVGRFGIFDVASLRDSAPPEMPPGLVEYESCDEKPAAAPATSAWESNWAPPRLFEPVFAPGLYPLEAMARSPGDPRPVRPPAASVSREEARAQARFLVFDPRCNAALSDEAKAAFEVLATRGSTTLFVRR